MTEQKIEELEPVTPFMMRRPETLPSFDGVIPLQSSSEPARYRVVSCLSRTFNAEQVRELVMHVCRVTCVAVEILRRRQPSRILAKFAEPECIERLEYMRSLLSDYMEELAVLHKRHIYPPVEFVWLNGVLTSECKLDISLGMRVGAQTHVGGLVFERKRGRWICMMVDIG